VAFSEWHSHVRRGVGAPPKNADATCVSVISNERLNTRRFATVDAVASIVRAVSIRKRPLSTTFILSRAEGRIIQAML
jgi:hypothetical protein